MEPMPITDYLARFDPNAGASGFAPFGVSVHMPCPFCGAIDFMVFRRSGFRVPMAAGAGCGNCARSARAEFTRGDDGADLVEIVQTAGSDPPAGVDIRRVY
jgi:hypothetical protein